MTERARQITYYLDQVTERVSLHPDGSIGELGERPKQVIEHLPSRRSDRPRTVERTAYVLAETALHDSIQDYLASAPRPEIPRYNEKEWSVEDFPDDVQDAFHEWRDSLKFSIDDLSDAASGMQAGIEALRTETVNCPDCSSDAKYACHRSAWSREMYRYPMVNFSHEGEDIMVALDIAGVAALNPNALRYEEQIQALGKQQRLNALRYLVFDITQIPASYIGASGGGMLQVNRSDKLRENIRMWVSEWNEQGSEGTPRRMHREPFDNRQQGTASEYVDALQFQLAKDICEVPETERYDEMLSDIQIQLGKRGLVATYEHSYDGMGESSPKLRALKKSDDHYLGDSYIASSISAADCLKAALAALHKERA